ncbi:MAG: hypothetical protein MHMPM18_001051 [Marteilia pararefringens]
MQRITPRITPLYPEINNNSNNSRLLVTSETPIVFELEDANHNPLPGKMYFVIRRLETRRHFYNSSCCEVKCYKAPIFLPPGKFELKVWAICRVTKMKSKTINKRLIICQSDRKSNQNRIFDVCPKKATSSVVAENFCENKCSSSLSLSRSEINCQIQKIIKQVDSSQQTQIDTSSLMIRRIMKKEERSAQTESKDETLLWPHLESNHFDKSTQYLEMEKISNSFDKSNQTDNDCLELSAATSCHRADSGESEALVSKVDASQQCCIDSLPQRTARNATSHIFQALRQQMRSNWQMRNQLDGLVLGGTRKCAININSASQCTLSENEEKDGNCESDLKSKKNRKNSSTLELEMSFTIVREKNEKISKNCGICRKIKDKSHPEISHGTKSLEEELILETKAENELKQKLDESKKKKSKLRKNHTNIREKSIEMKLIDRLRRQIDASLLARNQDFSKKDEILKIMEIFDSDQNKCEINLAALDESGKTPLIIYAIKAKCVELTSICLKYLNVIN